MILWTIKQLNAVRKAIAGRQHPAQLAWGIAFGLLLGIVPHGNLLAVALVILVLSLKLNHAIAGLTAVGISFAASHLDPLSHQVGQLVLTQPPVIEFATQAWQYPLVPWTDLNNTVVMGSLLIGLTALVPCFGITYPLFRLMARKPRPDTPTPDPTPVAAAIAVNPPATDRIVVVDRGHRQVVRPHTVTPSESVPPKSDSDAGPSAEEIEFVPVDEPVEPSPPLATGTKTQDPQLGLGEEGVGVETRIDVIRLKDYRPEQNEDDQPPSSDHHDEPMDEALNYLLRQLRASQQRNAA